MKIALVIEHFDATRGGAEHIAVWLAGRLAARGHEVHVLCHDAKRRMAVRGATMGASHDALRSEHAHGRPQAEAPRGVAVHKLRGLKLSTGLGFRMFGRKARTWCRRHKPDVAHSLSVAWPGDIYHPEAGVYARMQQQAVASRASRSGAMLKKWMQRLNGKQRVLLGLERRAVNPWKPGLLNSGAWKIICISGGMGREFAEHYGVGQERLVQLDNPRTSPLPQVQDAAAHRAWFRSHYGFKDNDRVAIFVGHDFRRKGLRWAIETIGRTKDWHLIVVGLGKLREYVERAEELGLSKRVKFIGPTREVERLYCASDALLLPVFYDPAPFVVIEALSCGLPVVSTSHLGSADIVRGNHVGVIVPEPRDVDLLANALESLPVNGEARDKMRERARRAAQGLPGEAVVDRLVKLYEEFVRAKAAK